MKFDFSKITLVGMLLALPFAASALEFVNGSYSDDRQSFKWSTTSWLNGTGEGGAAIPLKGMPGKSDTANMRARTDMLIDTNVEVKSFGMNGYNTATLDGKTLVVKRNVNYSIRWAGTTTELILKNAKADIGGSISMNSGFDNSTQGFGLAKIVLQDSVMTIGSTISCSLSLDTTSRSQSDRGGAEIHLIGKSLFVLKGEMIFDEKILTSNKNIYVSFIIEEKNGSVPSFDFGSGSPKNMRLEIKLSANLKKGKYEIFNFKQRKSQGNEFSSIKVNGRDYVLGDTLEVAGFVATVKVNAAGSGLTLEVK